MMEQYSPKTSPRGARSPSVSSGMNLGGQMEGGNLKLSIALGQKPTIIQKGPFYLMKQEAIPASEVTGATNLMASKGLEHSYIKLTSKISPTNLLSMLGPGPRYACNVSLKLVKLVFMWVCEPAALLTEIQVKLAFCKLCENPRYNIFMIVLISWLEEILSKLSHCLF